MTNTLVIDTSYGSTVGIVGHDPIIETDSRTHVERLQANIARAAAGAGLEPGRIERIVVGVGPAPFTGLRAGVVTAKALAYATGATLVGTDILSPQRHMMLLARAADAPAGLAALREQIGCPPEEPDDALHLTLAVNDARRRQLYFALYDTDADGRPHAVIPMDIDYPDHIAARVADAVAELQAAAPGRRIAVDVVGHGARKYADAWPAIGRLGVVSDLTLLDAGRDGLAALADLTARRESTDEADAVPAAAIEPLYLRRPDVSVPRPLKQVLHHAAADRTA